ncbi:hypothetical protein Rs2_18031 [Raphanus sativus]|nr:hypothetical protein Rs2_18031 [Raphanus sativus]
MLAYHAVFLALLIISNLTSNSLGLAMVAGVIISVPYYGVHVYFTALWHLGSVVSVLEPVYGLAAMRKAYELLKGKTRMAMELVCLYLALCGFIGAVFGVIVVFFGEYFGMLTRTLVGGLLLGSLVMVNLVGLLAQSVFYDHLGGYLGECVPLIESNIQLENLEI